MLRYHSSMENFFDVATPDELKQHVPSTFERPHYLALLRKDFEEDADRNAGYLAMLYFYRGDEEKTQYYLFQVKDEIRRMEFSTDRYELVEL